MENKEASPNPVESPPLAPGQIHSKVGAGAIAGSLAAIVLWGVGLAGIEMPPEIAVAVATVLISAAGWLAKS